MPDLFLSATPTIRKAATFGGSDTLRWTLTRTWDAALPRVCYIGHNPSTADHLTDDPTVRRWTHFARAWGYGGFVAVNLYPIRATDPAVARKWADWEASGPDWWVRDMLDQNRSIVAREAKASALTVSCWGAIAQDWDWIEHTLEHVTHDVAPWPDVYVFGLTASGAPIHPMARGRHRVPDTAHPTVWRKGAGTDA